MRGWASFSAETIDGAIEAAFGKAIKRQMIVHSADHAPYRFVDLFNAVEAFSKTRPSFRKIETEQLNELLNALIHDRPPQYVDRTIRKATKIVWHTGVEDQTYLPIDCYWLAPSPTADECFLFRLSFHAYAQVSRLELACGTTENGQNAMKQIIEDSRRHSIYRGQKLHLSYEAAKRDDYGNIEKQEQLQILFSAIEPVTEEDIVLSDEHLSVLKRNVIDIHATRDVLRANGVPTRRGVLLHGPPGTGKTFACRYLSYKLDGVTRIYVTGSSLIKVGAIFSLARLLQPTLLFLEDVDLVFSARDVNLYSTVLGELMDHLDGLRANEDITVVLTTNAIERLEAAVRDRPGRISQCVYMGPPNATLWRRYLEHHLSNRNTDDLDFDQLVAMSAGGTQAFLKEWIHRAVQIACERLDNEAQTARLQDSDFAAALSEMHRFLEGSDGKIIGFIRPTLD